MPELAGSIVLLGYGTIARCALPMLLRTTGLDASRFKAIDACDRRDELAAYRGAGLVLLRREVVAGNLAAVLAEATAPGDLLLNLSVGIDAISVADWCHRNGVLYVDTALEIWDEAIAGFAERPPAERTEYALHQRIRGLAAAHWRADGPTAIVTHGANPGLVSHFAKAALVDVARAMGLGQGAPDSRSGWARLAEATGLRAIHIAERDTQVSADPKRPEEFVNTWSIPGLVEEAMMPGEVGWGSHERRLPPDGREHAAGPRNAIYIERPAAHILLRSWVPLGGAIVGYALPHSESITLSDYLTLEDAGRPLYRPTVVFVYLPCDAALASLHETVMRDWRMQTRERIMTDDILEGRDELGVLLLGHGLGGWWYGSQLDIHESRRLLPGSNPTAIQVAAGAVSAVLWALDNPGRGLCEPEDLPYQEILALARPWLGPMVSSACDWTPLEGRSRLFAEPELDWSDPWQFGNFLVR